VSLRFGVERASSRPASVVRLQCREPLWTGSELALLDLFAGRGMRLPVDAASELEPGPGTEVLLRDESGRPVALRHGQAVWCPLDLARSLALLIGERYLPEDRPGLGEWLATWRPLQQAYYRAPAALRERVQRSVIRRLEAGRARWPEARFSTSYPVEATGWAITRALFNALRLAGAQLAVIDPWPAGHRACVVVTHDIEPAPYAYRRGLPRLLDWLAAKGHPPHTIGPVAHEAGRHAALFRHAALQRLELHCHGWLHDGRKTRLPRAAMLERLRLAKTTLEGLTGRSVSAFRSPRLDRNDTLYEALEASGYSCDSSVPDADRESTRRWGGGCSLNFPFHPAVPDGEGWRALSLVECPVTAPDCAMPVWAGATEAEACALFDSKLDYVEAIGGCYVAIFHSGTFDDADAGLRERLLEHFFTSASSRPMWRCTLGQLERWWRAREALCAWLSQGALVVKNAAPAESPAVVVRVGDGEAATTVTVPPLAPGGVFRAVP
jgi:hypothetical protein